ncbi:MAG: class I SAM-dependent methyltransferase [Pirellulaceae bacterium]
MLPRVLETELLDTADEAREYSAMDRREVNRQFVEDLLASCPEPHDVLDVGTGTAQIPIELCRRVSTCRVMAADKARAMLELARYGIEIASMLGRIQLDCSDAKQMLYKDGMFDLVMCNGTLHHFAEPMVALKESVRVTAPGGWLFFRDLLRPPDSATLNQLVATYAGEANELQQQMFRNALHASLSLDEVRAMVEQLGFAPETVQATGDRHWTWCAGMPGRGT